MKTYEISRDEIDGMSYVEGYKAVNYDLSTIGDSKFRYGEKGENIVGKIFKFDGNVKLCQCGLHFSKNPAHVFNFYGSLGYNRYFKIRAYGKVFDDRDGYKSVANVIEFVEEYDLMQYIRIIKGLDISADGNNHSYGNYCSYGNNWSSGNNNSDGNHYSYGNNWSSGNNNSCGNNLSSGTNYSCYLYKCDGASECILCYKKDGIFRRIFNRKVTKARFDEVWQKLMSFGWYPKFNNIYDLKGNKEWWAVCFPELVEYKAKEAWVKMPDEMREYIMSLPEYDEKIFKAITEGE